jgi:hypothetical protein
MKFLLPLAIGLCAFLPAQSQSLYQDAKNLAAASKTLEETGYNLQDSAAMEAFSQMMAILYAYDNPMSADSFSRAQLMKLPNRYRENPNIPDLLPIDSLVRLLDTADAGFAQHFQNYSGALRESPREKMIELLRGDYGASPAEYLSVSRALRRYSIPPVESLQNLQVLAQNSNQNVQGGLVNSQAIIMGMFDFILKRAQEEIVINFMERFLTDELIGYEAIFPTVCEQFSAPEISYSHSFIERVRDALYQDMQLLSVRLPVILLEEGRFEKLQEDPIIFNLLAIYSIIGMVQNDLPVEEIIPITHRNLFENYNEAQKKLNFTIAGSPVETPEYQELVNLTRKALDRIKSIYLGLEQGEAEIAGDGDFSSVFEPAYSLEAVMGSDTAASFRLNLLPHLLNGQLDTAYLLGFRNVQAYDKFFGAERSPEQWRAAGLELARNLNGTWYNDQSIDQYLRNWAADLSTYRAEYDKWQRETDPDKLEKDLQKLETGRQKLAGIIGQTKAFWVSKLGYNQGLAFDMLEAIVSNSFDPSDIQVMIEMMATGQETFLVNGQRKLLDVEERLLQLNDRIGAQNPGPQIGNPIHAYLDGKESPHPYAPILAQLELLSADLAALKKQMTLLDAQLAAGETRRMNNARPLLQTTESLTHLLYCLRSDDPERKWITREELDSILNTQNLREAFLGLLYQRVCQVHYTHRLSPEGLAQLVQLTVGDLPLLLSPPQIDTLTGADLSAFDAASFLVNTLSRVLEIPLIVDPEYPQAVRTLVQTFPETLDRVPEVSRWILDLIYYLNIRDHRRAMTAAIRLFSLFEQPGDKDSVLAFLKKYGFFISDLVDAQTKEEVESLLNGIADPPGSSRLKRTSQTTVGLNAYLGALAANETWVGPNQTEVNFLSVAPTMPIGITLSRRISAGNKPQSLSLFLGFLDLGAILSFRGDTEDFGENRLTFKNMFKPSAQLHWNLPKSPFYIGSGVQIGPHYRTMGDQEQAFQSTRFFLSFGVDVPVKTFFVR